MRGRTGPAAYGLALLLAAAGGPASADEGKPKSTADPEIWHRGRLDLRYVYRSTGESDPDDRETDQDLIQDLFIEGGRGADIRFEASGRLREDIDSHPDVSVFRDIHDTYDDPVKGYLYTGFGEVLDAGIIARGRLGRQYYGEGVEVRFDGGLVETQPLGDAVKLAAYGGVPVHLFESSRRGDWIAGGAAEVVSIPRTTIRFDYAHVTDFRRDLENLEDRDGVDRDALRDDDYFQLQVVHRLTTAIRLRGKASTFQGKSSRFEVEGLYLDPDIDFTSRLRYIFQVGAYRDLSIQLTPLDEALGTYEPYHEVLFDLRKGIGDHLAIGGGVQLRELRDQGDEGPFNHEYLRAFGFGEVRDWPWGGLTLAATADSYWSGAGLDGDRTFQVYGDLSQEIGDFTVAGGSSYARFRFDEFFMEEREDVRTYYGSLEWRPRTWLRVRTSYSFEVDDEERYHVARVDVRIDF